MKFVYDDGGRSKYFQATSVGDCVCRAIAIATESDYMEIYKLLNEAAKHEKKSKRKRGKSSARNGVHIDVIHEVLADLGWTWHACMTIGSGCTTHLREDELPSGRLIARTSKHLTAVIDGVIHDTYNPSRNGTRCVYGYWQRG